MIAYRCRSDCGATPEGCNRKCGAYYCGAVVEKTGPNDESFFVGECFEDLI